MKASLFFSPHSPYVVQLTLLNNSLTAEFLALDKFHTLNEDSFLFDVPVKYLKSSRKKDVYTRPETIRLQAGASSKTFINLLDYYDLENVDPAPQKVKYSTEHPVNGFEDNVHQLELVESDWVDLGFKRRKQLS